LTGQTPAEVEFRRASVAVPAGDGFPARTILSDLELHVVKGETLVLLGRSGAGKTTALKLINRLLEPTSGDVLVEGRSTRAWDPIALRRRTGYVIQETGLLPHFSVEQNVGLVPRLAGWSAARIQARVAEMLALVGLEPDVFARRYPRALSGGQRQRVGVARALAADPELLLMDEPFGALDPVTRVDLQAQFQALMRRLGKTVVFVTHDLREALFLGTRIALLAEGRLSGVYSPAEFLTTSDPAAGAYVAAFALRDPHRGGEAGPSPIPGEARSDGDESR
jgi:osmoprotectant transport system ATP-binding protein